MYKFPIRIPQEWRVIITQGFKSTELAEWYKKQGLDYPEHLAIDLVIGNPEYTSWTTYGATVVCPFPTAELITCEPGTGPDGKGGRFQIETTLADGTKLRMGGIHCSEVVNQSSFKEGDIVAYIGNGGYVKPAPTPEKAYAGGHLHLSRSEKKVGELNFTPKDPLEIFNIYEPFRGEDSGFEKDIKPIAWAMGWNKEKINEILTMVRNAMNKS